MAEHSGIEELRRRLEEAKRKQRELNGEKPDDKPAEGESAAGAGEGEDPSNPNGPPDYRSIWVGSLDPGVRQPQLENYFASCGKIVRCTVKVDHHTKRPLGYGYVEFETRRGVENALLLNGHLLMGKGIRVTEKRENKPNMGAKRSFQRGGFRGR